jgi:hypothetical protein
MITEELLERGLADVANEYDVPSDATARIREQLMSSTDDDGTGSRRWQLHRPTPRGWLVLSAAAIVIIVIVSFAIGGGGTSNNVETAASGGGGAAADEGNRNSAKVLNRQDAPGVAGDVPVVGASPAPRRAPAVTGTGSLVAGAGSASGGTSARTFDSVKSPPVPVPTAQSKVIKTGELDLQVPKGKVGTALDLVTGIATLEHGYIANSRTSEGGGTPSGQITMRVPVANFEDTVKRARTLDIDGVKVLNLQTSGKDVTSKYVDLKARISALKKTRETFLTLLSRATTIGQTLAVQQHVTDVQTQIEQLQGQTKVLVNQAALSTLTVTVDQKAAQIEAAPTHHKSGLHKAVDRSVSRFVHGIEAIIGIIGPLLLVALLGGIAWLAARFGYRRLRRRMV